MILLKDFKVNEEGRFSITRPYESLQIINIIESFLYERDQKDLSILTLTDATACMGGDLIRFSKHFKFVNGIEIHKENYQLLVENCKKYECNNVKLYNADYLSVYDNLHQDVIYIDPPWGGTEYKNMEQVSLKIGDTDLYILIKLVNQLTKFLFIKVPLNVCLDNIEYTDIQIVYNRSKIPSFKLIMIAF